LFSSSLQSQPRAPLSFILYFLPIEETVVAIVSINIELVAEIPLTINESSRQEGQSYVDLITEAATAFMENNDLNQLDFQVKVVGDVIAAE
jgi:hypothetical protein